MARIVIKDLKSKKSLTRDEIKEVIGGQLQYYLPRSRLVGSINLPRLPINIDPNLLKPSSSTQNTSCCDGYICIDGQAVPV